MSGTPTSFQQDPAEKPITEIGYASPDSRSKAENGAPTADHQIENGDLREAVASKNKTTAVAGIRAAPTTISQKPLRRAIPDISNLLLVSIFTSSLAGLTLAGVETTRSDISANSAAVFVGTWALLASVLLVLTYFLCRQKKVVRFATRSNSRLFWTTLTCSCLTIGTTALAFSFRPDDGVELLAKIDTQALNPAPSQAARTTNFNAPIDKFSLSAEQKFSEHYPVMQHRVLANPASLQQNQPVAPQSDPVDISPDLNQIAKERPATHKITPVAAKPDRTVKAEKPKPSNRSTRKATKKKRTTKNKPVAVQLQPTIVNTPEKTAEIAQALKVKSSRKGVFYNNNNIDCSGSAAFRKTECRDQTSR
jgi:hypothetical protein